MLGMRWFASSSTTATCIAAGKVSFVDCDMLTWSLGCTGVCVPRVPAGELDGPVGDHPPFTFMFDWVPEPVCQNEERELGGVLSGDDLVRGTVDELGLVFLKSPPARRSPGRRPSSRCRRPGTTACGIRSSPIEKWCSERWVCAPQSRSCGTRTGPIESVSIRYLPPSMDRACLLSRRAVRHLSRASCPPLYRRAPPITGGTGSRGGDGMMGSRSAPRWPPGAHPLSRREPCPTPGPRVQPRRRCPGWRPRSSSSGGAAAPEGSFGPANVLPGTGGGEHRAVRDPSRARAQDPRAHRGKM
jgi:hypothetical protein